MTGKELKILCKFGTYLFAQLFAIASTLYSQTENSNINHEISRGWNFEFGGFPVIPTSSILFKKWRDNKPDKINKTISNEWEDSFFLGDYWAVSKNVGKDKPIIIGIKFSSYQLFYDFDLRFTPSSDVPIEWELINLANFNNYNIFINYPFWFNKKVSTFCRVSMGMSHFLHRVYTDWKKVNWADSKFERIDLVRENSYTINTSFGLGIRWQALDFLALQAKINYQFQGYQSFSRFYEVVNTNINLELTNTTPVEDDFQINQLNNTQEPVLIQYENLYLLVGIAFDLNSIFKGLSRN